MRAILSIVLGAMVLPGAFVAAGIARIKTAHLENLFHQAAAWRKNRSEVHRLSIWARSPAGGTAVWQTCRTQCKRVSLRSDHWWVASALARAIALTRAQS